MTKSRRAAFLIGARSVKVREAERNEKKEKKKKRRGFATSTAKMAEGGGGGQEALSKVLSLAAVSARRKRAFGERAELALG